VDDPLLMIDEVIAELWVSRAAFYRWRRRAGPGGGVPVRRGALTEWLRGMEEAIRVQEAGTGGQHDVRLRH
jgi:hypothetical protein